jgi:putative membrane protein
MLLAVSPWKYHAHPEVWLILAAAIGGYWYLIRRVGPSQVKPGEPVVTAKQARIFITAVVLLWLFADWPIHDLAERRLYFFHMAQHLVFSLVVPPLLIIGTPQWLQRWLFRPKAMDYTIKRICKPVPAAVIFNCVVAIGHAPFYVDYTLEHDPVHFFAHLLLFVASLIMWFPVLNRTPEYPSLGQPAAMVYLFIQSIIPNVPVAFLAFADGVVYKFYATVPRTWGLSAVEDQQIAAAVMKVGGTLIIWSVIFVQFIHWYEREHGDAFAKRRIPPPLPEDLTWDDVENELSRTKPSPH